IPAISAGIYGYPPDDATLVITETAADHASTTETSLRAIRLVGYDDAMATRFVTALSGLISDG
ncbi:MAG: RNase III inhibitor, partial [Acidimicrobiia bacterium]